MTNASISQDELIALFKDKNALLEGHFLLSSGLHSDRYFQSALLLQYPDLAEKLGKWIADLFPEPVDVVVSPAIGGLIIGQEVARAKKCRAIFSEKDANGNPALRRDFSLDAGEKVLLIEDVITTGLSTAEVVRLLDAPKAELVGISAILLRSQKGKENLKQFNKPIRPLVELDVQAWEENNLPDHLKNTPAVKPGSRKK